MKRLFLATAFAWSSVAALADPSITTIVDDHIVLRFETLAVSAQALSDAAIEDCDVTSVGLQDAYHTAFDAWISASHLRFGPTEVDDRAFALAFWPDSRGATPRALAALIADADPIAASPADYADVSIAARGFYALEFLLYDDTLMQAGDAAYHCTLVQTISADIARISDAVYNDWENQYRDVMLTPDADASYRSDAEVLQEMLKALNTGLQFTQESRIGRPLGTFDRPRPTRAEARRSGRSARHVLLSLTSLHDLTSHLTATHPTLSEKFDRQFADVLARLADLNDPIFATVDAPQSRFKIEVIQQNIGSIRTIVETELGPTLGVAAGFNALDGD